MAAKSKRWSVREICGGAHFRASLIVTEAHFTNYKNVKVVKFEQPSGYFNRAVLRYQSLYRHAHYGKSWASA